MSAARPATARDGRRPARRTWLIAAILGGGAIVLLAQLLSAERVLRFALDKIAPGLGLRVEFTGPVHYRLAGGLQLVVDDVTATAAHDSAPMLRADRVLLALPWRTIRSGGREPVLERIELDRPQLDLPALQRWLDSRPTDDDPSPVVEHGLQIRNGRVDAAGWSIDALDLELPRLGAGSRLDARASGLARLDAQGLQLPFDLHLQAGSDNRLQARGTLAAVHTSGRLEGRIEASATRAGDAAGDLALSALRLAMDARWQPAGQGEALPFAFGLYGDLHVQEDGIRMAPLGLALRGEGAVPTLHAGGRLASAGDLKLVLAGRLAQWPAAWPALPPPLADADEPMAFAVRYSGPLDASAPVGLHIEHPQARFEGETRLPAMLDWLDTADSGSPLPPLRGRVEVQRVEVSGATLRGVQIQFDDGTGERP